MTTARPLPAIQKVGTLSTLERAAVLDTLFEPCTQLHTLSVSTLSEKTFDSYPDLIAAVGQQLTDLYQSNLEADQKWLDAILSAHPRLGEKKVESELSRLEQDAMRKAEGGDSEDVAEKLQGLNAKYEDVFPGLRYVVFVNGRPRSVIIEDMQKRIDRGDIKQEKLDAIQAMCDIAVDRAKKLGTE